MSGSYPNTVNKAHQETMKEEFWRAIPCNNVGTNDEDNKPANSFNIGWNKEHRSQCHCEAKQGKLND